MVSRALLLMLWRCPPAVEAIFLERKWHELSHPALHLQEKCYIQPRRPLRLTLQFFANHGLRQGLRLLALRATGRVRDEFSFRLETPFDLYPRQAPPAIHPFDLLYHVDTSGFRHGADLGRGAGAGEADTPRPALRSALWNTAYYGIAPSIFDGALALVGIAGDPAGPEERQPPDWSRFTFVDLGCGKGRALLLASRYPFRHILGVELDATLAGIAQANIGSFHAPWQQTRSIAALHADATAIDLPPTPIVLYLYHPFLAPSLRRVLRRLEVSLRRHPREIWLVYINPSAAHVLRGFPFLREMTRATLLLDPDDALPDRLGSTREEVALYHAAPPG